MIKTVTLQLSPQKAAITHELMLAIASKEQVKFEDIGELRVLKRSVDARSRTIKVTLEVMYAYKQKHLPHDTISFAKQNVSQAPEIHIIGTGPAGLFAALTCIENGFKPVVLERGKDIHERKRDIAKLHKNDDVNVNSNYCFGEGGAGTFSDGKLYTRSKKKGDVQRVLELFVFHGASENILVEAHPHIGTDKLPDVIKNIRNTIIECGGEVHFSTHISNFVIQNQTITALQCADGMSIPVKSVILATGHSAHDVYYALHDAGVLLEAKSSAMGVRAEHPQKLIDYNQYHGQKSPYLPPASYSLVQQVQERGVYSFCMCPGGIIVPASTQPKQLVVNGMSNSTRNSPFANSGFAVQILTDDYKDFAEYGPLAGLKYQEQLEMLAFQNGGKNQIAPAQTIADFVYNKVSTALPACSYNPGVISSPLHFWLPEHIRVRLQEAFKVFDKKIRGFVSHEAIILGVESRTSSPVRIPRNNETYQHIQIENLYPCGEGSGYAGGITSSAVDGCNAAYALVNRML